MRKAIKIFKNLFKSRRSTEHSIPKKRLPAIIPRKEHNISRNRISQAALKVLYRLHKAGFAAYLVGGSVRDLLLGGTPKDFDVATDAHPEQVHKLFQNSYIVGRRFRLVHVRFGSEIIEVATFRGYSDDNPDRVQTQHGMIIRDNVYGTLEDDVWRRDFTVNALYYNIADFSVVDYTGGVADLKQKCIRVIGDPDARYREDPARMLRAIRFAAKLGFEIESDSAELIKSLRELLLQVPPARLFDKLLKIFHSGKSFATYQLLSEYNLFSVLFPRTQQVLADNQFSNFVTAAFKNTDDRINKDMSVNSAFLFSVLLWGPLQRQKIELQESENLSEYPALISVATDVIQDQLKYIAIPRRYTLIVREIWLLQFYLLHARSRRIYHIFHHPRFRAGYDFLGLRYQSGEIELKDIFTWWSDFQEADEKTREKLIRQRFSKAKPRKRKKRAKQNDTSIHSTGE